MPSIEAHPIVALEENMGQQREQQVIDSLGSLEPTPPVASFSPQTKETDVVTAVPEPISGAVPASVAPAPAAKPPAPIEGGKSEPVGGDETGDPVLPEPGVDAKATAIAIPTVPQSEAETPPPRSFALSAAAPAVAASHRVLPSGLPALLFLTPVADAVPNGTAENLPLIKAENVDIETKQQSPLPSQPSEAKLAEPVPADDSQKLSAPAATVTSAEPLPAAVVVTDEIPTSTVLQASISSTPPPSLSVEASKKGNLAPDSAPAAVAVTDSEFGQTDKAKPPTAWVDKGDGAVAATECVGTATTSTIWPPTASTPTATFPSADNTTAITAAAAAAAAGAAVQREQQQYAELRADALNAAASQTGNRADARAPLSISNFETKLQLDPMSLFSGLSGLGSSALFASQALTSALHHPATCTEAQFANHLRAAFSEQAKTNGLYPALGALTAEEYSRGVDLLTSLAAQQHLALLSSGAAPTAEAVCHAHNAALLFSATNGSNNANPFPVSTSATKQTITAKTSGEATTVKIEGEMSTTTTSHSTTSTITSTVDASGAAAKDSEDGTVVVATVPPVATTTAAAVAVTTTAAATATITTAAIPTTATATATVASTVKADPITASTVADTNVTPPQFASTSGRGLTRDELFLAQQAKHFAVLRASLLANAANSPLGTAARSLSARVFGNNQRLDQDSSSNSASKIMSPEPKGANAAAPLAEGGADAVTTTSESVHNVLASAMKLLNNDPAALRDFSTATTKERAMLLRTINMQISRTNQLAGKIQQIRRLPATLQTIHSLMPTGAHNRFNLLGRNQIPFGDHYNLLYAAERSQGRPFAGATGGAGAQRQHAIFGERGAGHGGADPLSLHMVHNSAAAVASMHMTPQANTAFSRHVAAGLGMKPVMYGPTGNQSAVNVPSALRATTAAQQQQQGVGMSPSTETKPTKDSKRRGKRSRQQQQQRPPANTMQTPKKIKKSNDGEEDEEDETPVGWVQCNRCKEWRQLPRHIDAESLPDQWFCKDATWQTDMKCKKVSRRTPKKQSARSPRSSNASGSSSNRRSQNGARGTDNAVGSSSKSEDKTPRPKAREASGRQSNRQGKSRSMRRKGSRSSKKDNDTINWVQCEKCSKWRQVPGHIKLTTPKWFCTMNTWDANPSCSVPEDADADDDDIANAVETPKPTRSRSSNTPSQSARSRRTPNRGSRSSSHLSGNTTPSNSPRTSRRSNKLENFEWVECVICRTWRKLPKHVKTASLPDKWDCSMNKWDPKRNSCTAPQEKSETAQSTKGRCNAGGATRKKPSFLPSYRELIRAHYRTGGHHRSTTNVKSGFGQGMRKSMQESTFYCSSKSRKRQNAVLDRREKKRSRNTTDWWHCLPDFVKENGKELEYADSCERMAVENRTYRAAEKLRHRLIKFLSKAQKPLTLDQILSTVGEPAALLRGIVLQQLQELKEDQHVTTEVNDDDSDSIEEDRDGAEGSDNPSEPKVERWLLAVNERKPKGKRHRTQLNFLRQRQELTVDMPVFVALPPKLAKPWKSRVETE